MLKEKSLKSYKGFRIIKSWEVDIKGRVKKNTTNYSFLDEEGNIIDCEKTLKECKKSIDMWCPFCEGGNY